ncbi:GAF domain-containing sensor histidine kinase [Ferrovibrio sp.]|uniref:GAF domain-containing sensor histidine kinase n=1 Tax=Ferrovibrio sp. TaxID=1917215 RepID=UPI001B41983E|nr:GAF domain-containing sensor histidine kinase [Ferrovibrio sp.]MBP7064118.1 GAF domain-containing sensor histidine kinase [Ferrovibrio sp.]
MNQNPSYPIPQNEAERLASLRSYRILDTSIDPRFERLTKLTAELIEAPIAVVSLVDEKRQWFKSHRGLETTETSRCIAFCAHAIMDDAAFVVEDALADPRFATNPLVLDVPFIRFYAGMPIKAADGHRIGVLCVIDTVPRQISQHQLGLLAQLALLASDEIELHKQQLDAKQHAEARARAEQAQNLLLNSINHEFRTPLNAVLGFSELLSENVVGPLNESQRDYLHAIRRGGGDILRLVSGIMDMAALERRNVAPQMARIDVEQVLLQAVERHRALAHQHGLEIGFHICNRTCNLKLDPQHLNQVLGNLIRNAILYNRPDGAIEVGCEHDEDGRVLLYVADTGTGIPAARQGETFQMFNRLGRESGNIPGTGIGLALSKRLVEAMGGSIGFESIEGQGSRFWTRFQAA